VYHGRRTIRSININFNIYIYIYILKFGHLSKKSEMMLPYLILLQTFRRKFLLVLVFYLGHYIK